MVGVEYQASFPAAPSNHDALDQVPHFRTTLDAKKLLAGGGILSDEVILRDKRFLTDPNIK